MTCPEPRGFDPGYHVHRSNLAPANLYHSLDARRLLLPNGDSGVLICANSTDQRRIKKGSRN